MSGTKILWGQITIVFLIVLVTTWGATQYVAWSLGYQAQLGEPWFRLFGVPVYFRPLSCGGGTFTTPMRRAYSRPAA